ncbi:uncharacterized protein RCO7_07303 [Rhynchosporium graminicola]|uniref:DUF4185 domain-containing protein n=1 Tax=Rhynchosporium graminicola TaxID=2792576 RepID=A0A1E1LA00_9HELO|nr:uncharacterized protein RCO7_07303 [Rhynchosporium commune]
MSKYLDKLNQKAQKVLGHSSGSNNDNAPPIPFNTKPSTSLSPNPNATLPDPQTFTTDLNQKWKITKLGPIYSSSIPRIGWDKGRTSTLSGTTFWNFGDVVSLDGPMKNGFCMGAAWYANPNNILEVDTRGCSNVAGWEFAKPHESDPKPPGGNEGVEHWGMDTSNIAEVEPGVGVGFAWVIHRNTVGKEVYQGLGVLRVTLGKDCPVAERVGPLVTGPDELQMGLMTIINAEGYIYTYSNGGITGIIVGRAKVADAVDTSKYEFLRHDGNWVQGIPKSNDVGYGIKTIGQEQAKIHSDGQGSIMFNKHLNKYMLFTCMFGHATSFYMSDTPYGPWTPEYRLLDEPGYGINVHPSMSEDHRILYISSGTMENIISMWKVEFGY